MKKTTDELLKILNSIETVSALENYTESLTSNNTNPTFSQFINDCLLKSHLTAASLIQNAQIQRNYGYQILNGTKNPGRNKVIALCLALSLDLSDTQRALTLARESILYAKNKRDSIIIFSINRQLSVLETNDLLYAENEELL